MMKIGVLTIINVNNYGAELQAFALVKKLEKIGCDAEIINYLFYKNPRYKKTSISKPIKNIKTVDYLKEIIYPYYNSIKSIPYFKYKQVRDKKFLKFHQCYTKMSEEYRSLNELYKKHKDYDVFLVGSDQVWNPNSKTNLEPYLLSFVKENKIKASYASSFGVNEIEHKYHQFYNNFLKRFQQISVREKSGIDVLKSITKRNDVDWVLDPTFLLSKSDWLDYQSEALIDEPYILLYVLNDSKYLKRIAKRIAKEKNYKIVRLCKKSFKEDSDESVINILDAGPKEYIRLFNDASFIITTSFHGTCFSVNFEKPFFSILNKRKNNNSRLIDLLTFLKLDDRILYVNDLIKGDIKYNIDYSKHTEIKNSKLEFSVNFLKKIINYEKI